MLLLGLRQGQEERQERHGQTIVEAGLDVEGLAQARGDTRVAHDRLAQGSVGGGEDGSHDSRLPEREVGEQQRRDGRSQRDGERHPYAEEAQRQSLVLAQGREVGARGIGEEHDREGDLAQQQHGVLVERELGNTKSRGTEDDTRRDEHERRRKDRSFQPPRHEAEGEHHGGQHDEINHRRLRYRGRSTEKEATRFALSAVLARPRRYGYTDHGCA